MPRHFTTALDGPGTKQSYRAVCYRAAKVLYDLFGDLALTQDPTYDAVVAASEQLRKIRKDFDQDQIVPRSENLSGQRIERCLVDMTIAYRDYQCHRLYFVKAFTDNRYARSYTACTNAARTIHAVSRSQLPRPYLLMWNSATMVVASGIILALDHILKPDPPRNDDQRDGKPVVASIADQLRQLQDPSGIATRGATLIDHLLALGDQRKLGLVKDVTITREAVLELVASSQRAHIPDDLILHQQPTGRNQYGVNVPLANTFDGNSLNLGGENLEQQDPWMNGPHVDLFNQHDIDFDFAQLLGQIMPNAG